MKEFAAGILVCFVVMMIWLQLFFRNKPVTKNLPEEKETPIPDSFLDESKAKPIELAQFREIFEDGAIIIEKETYGYTTDWAEWNSSDAKLFVPKHCTSRFDLATDRKSYAMVESFMIEGKVYTVDIKKAAMFATEDEVKEHLKTLFAVYLVYQGVSPFDNKTTRYFVMGCTENDGVVPTHGLSR